MNVKLVQILNTEAKRYNNNKALQDCVYKSSREAKKALKDCVYKSSRASQIFELLTRLFLAVGRKNLSNSDDIIH